MSKHTNMKKFLSVLLLFIIFAASAFSQKIYFPASLYDDPKAFDKAIPGVAEKVISSLSDKEKKEHGKVVDYSKPKATSL